MRKRSMRESAEEICFDEPEEESSGFQAELEEFEESVPGETWPSYELAWKPLDPDTVLEIDEEEARTREYEALQEQFIRQHRNILLTFTPEQNKTLHEAMVAQGREPPNLPVATQSPAIEVENKTEHDNSTYVNFASKGKVFDSLNELESLVGRQAAAYWERHKWDDYLPSSPREDPGTIPPQNRTKAMNDSIAMTYWQMAFFLDNFSTFISNYSFIDELNLTIDEDKEIVDEARRSAEFMMEMLTATDVLFQHAEGKNIMPNTSMGQRTTLSTRKGPRPRKDPEDRWKGKWRNPSPPPVLHPGTPSFKYPPSPSTPSFGGRFAADAAQFESWRSSIPGSQAAPFYHQPSNLHLVALAQRLGIQLKYTEPPESSLPKKPWRLYEFSAGNCVRIIDVSSNSYYLIGREGAVRQILGARSVILDHHTISGQHAVIQYRSNIKRSEHMTILRDEMQQDDKIEDGDPYFIDLGSTNGSFLNGMPTEPMVFYRLKNADTLRFALCESEFVLLFGDNSIAPTYR